MNAKVALIIVLAAFGGALLVGGERVGVRPHGGLHNVHRLNARVLSGSSPEGDRGFAELRARGVRTILSVDGAAPDVQAAAEHGLQYVHLPIGYDGIAPDRLKELAKTLRDLPGPIYVHCHHGKHRGPAAAVAATMCLDRTFTPEQAIAWMKNAGTDPHYRGLYAVPHTLLRPSSAELDALPIPNSGRADVPDLAKRMVLLDETWDRLKALRANRWNRLPDKPDLDAAHEALQLLEHYREATRLPRTTRLPWAEAEREATMLETALRGRTSAAEVEPAFQAAAKRCTSCHSANRDNKQ